MLGAEYSLRGRVIGQTSRAGLAGLRVVAADRIAPGASVLVDGITDGDGLFELEFAADDALALLSAGASTDGIWEGPVVLHLSAYDGGRRLGTWTRTTTARALLSGGSLGDLEVEAAAATPNAGLTARVRTPAGEPIVGLEVVLERIDLSGRTRAGRGLTDAEGATALTYAFGPRGTRADTDGRLQIAVSADGREVARSAVLFGLVDGQEVTVVVDDDQRVASELDRLRAASGRVVDDARLTRLDPEQFEMVAADAGVYPPHLAAWIAALRLAAGTRVDPSQLYGLARVGVPLDPAALFVHAPATYADGLRRAVKRRIVPEPRGGVDAAARALTAAMHEAASQRIASAEPGRVTPSWAALRGSGLAADRLQAFARRWLALEGPSAARWASLRADPELRRDADLLEFTADVSSAVGHHQPVVEALVAERGAGRVSDVRALTSWSVERWTDFLRGRGLPPALAHLPADEGLRRFAESAARAVEFRFPTAVLAERLGEDELPGATTIRRMVRSEPGFDLDRTVIARFVADHPDVLPGADRERVVASLSRLQRVHGLTRGFHRSDITRALLRRGIGSAAEVARFGQASFVRRFSADLDGLHPQRSGGEVARDVFARARTRHGTALAWTSTFARAFQGTPMAALASFELTGADPVAASLRSLFGSLDYCACEHCRSMFSPAAYLVDLLSFLAIRPATDASSALAVLRQRRGDLARIELSCANTTTEMPYVDLVLELLEQLAVDVDAPLEPRQTRLAPAELRVRPEHRVDLAYERTAQAVFPWSLPFDLSGLRVRAAMTQLGAPRAEAMVTLARPAPVEPPAMDVVAESLSISPVLLQIITGTTAYPEAEFPATPAEAAWGMAGAAGWDATLAADVGQLIRRAAMSVLELRALLALPFIAPDGGVAVVFDTPSCDLADARVQGLDAHVLDRLHRFVRLRRAVPLTPAELDRAVAQLGGGTLDAAFARDLVDHLAVVARLRRPSNLVLALWHSLDTRRRGEASSPYELLFQNRVSTPELDPAFALVGDDVTEVTLSEEHFATIRAALRVTDTDLRLLIGAVLPAEPTLSVAALSTLHRHVLLARAAGRSIADLLRLLRILPGNPFAGPRATIAFLDALDPLKGAKLSVAELDYVLRHQLDPSDPVDLGDSAIDDLLAAIAAAVAEGDAVIDAVQGELVDVVAGHLAVILPGPVDVSAWMAILAMASAQIGPAELTVLAAGLTGVVAEPDAGAQEIADTAAGLARLTLVRDLLVAFRRAQVREPALVTTVAERLSLDPAAARALLFDILHEGGAAARDVLLPGGGAPAVQRLGVRRLHKAALVIRGVGIETAELSWFFAANQATRGMDLDALPLGPVDDGSAHFLGLSRVMLGKSLREELADPSAIEQASAAADIETAVEVLATATGWNAADIAYVLGPSMLDVEPSGLEDPQALAAVRAAVDLVRRTGVAAERLAGWARARSTPPTATDVLAALRSRYDDATWAAVLTSIADRFRVAQRDALIDLLIGRGDFHDAIALYDRLLVDPLMEPCMLTSRIRLAMSAAQLFIQRALMRLEDGVELTPADALQWEWMKNYRVWEANRKVFFYPENWIEPELRDDKSPFFLELERHLSQAELDDAYVEAGYTDYLRKLHEVSHLEVPALVRDASGDGDKPVVHVLGRTRGLPMTYYHRTRVDDAYWTPWTKVPVDIPTDQVTLATHNRRLFALWVEAQEEAAPGLGASGAGVKGNGQDGLAIELGGETPPEPPPKILRVRIGWTEYRDGAWAPKKITSLSDAHSEAVDHYTPRHLCVVAFERGPGPMLFVDVLARKGRTSKAIATFRYDDCRDVLEERPVTTILYDPHDLGMGDGTVADRQRDHPLVETSLPDEGLDLPLWDATAKDYDSRLFLVNLPHEYWVTPARQGDLYTGLTPVVFDDEDRAFYIVPQLVETPPPQGITPGADPWESYALLPAPAPAPSAISLARSARRASATGPAPWSGAVPGLLHARGLARDADVHTDAVLAWADAHAVLPAGSATGEIAIAPAPIGASAWVWGYRIDRFHHPYTCAMLASLNRHGIEGVLAPKGGPIRRQLGDEPVIVGEGDAARPYRPMPFMVKTPFPRDDFDFTFGGAYSVYNWELFFHAPLLIAERLRREQKFAEAQRWYHFVFNPLAGTEPGEPGGIARFWNVKPLYQEALGGPIDVIRAVFLDEGLTADPELVGDFFAGIGQWLENPFSPHAIARVRAGTYQRVVVRKYLDNLLAWGDFLFRQDTMESLNEATQIYLLAAAILGPRPEPLPALDVPVRTYDDLLAPILFGGLTELENFIPDAKVGNAGPADDDTPPPGPIWWAFCLPPNDNLLAYWDVVADRLFKIRHCQNIDGVTRSLALFEPPIDPALLVRARALGLDFGGVVAGLNAPLPLQRFRALHARAVELCADVRALGAALLAALERRDAGHMERVRAEHEVALLEAVRDVRVAQLDEAERQLTVTSGQAEVIRAREAFYSSRDKMSDKEKDALALAAAAFGVQLGSQALRTLAGMLHLVPDFDVGFLAIAPHVKLRFGGANIGPSLSAAAEVLAMVASGLEFGAQRTATLAGYERRKDDWTFQAEQATLELAQVKRQELAAQVRVDIARSELANHERQIEQSRVVAEILRARYTSEELYEWMIGEVAAVHFQSYQLALDMARKAEGALRFELGRDDLSIVTAGHWDSLKKGLLAGERLQLELRRLDAAHVEHNRREYELVKHVSLRQLDPLALLALKATGVCEVELPEWLFDLDGPGHYMRRIRTVAFSVPCVVGPYASVNCTATLLRSEVRYSPLVAGGYARDGADAARFVDHFGGVQSVVTSRGSNDSGLFDAGGADDRYLPFEGSGVIGAWRFELPREVRQFDYDTIADVIVHMSYTAREAGGDLRQAATESLLAILEDAADAPLVLLVSLRSECAGEWHRYVSGEPLVIELTRDRFPYIAHGRTIQVQQMQLVLASTAQPVPIDLGPGQVGLDTQPAFAPGQAEPIEMEFAENEELLPRDATVNAFLLLSYTIQ